jgi:hypothetical protein
MNGHVFTSVFAAELDAYLAFKAGMGFTGNSRIWYLRRFDAYWSEHNRNLFDQDTVEGWGRPPAEKFGPLPVLVVYIRDFGRWLNTNGATDAYVLSDRWKAPFLPSPLPVDPA